MKQPLFWLTLLLLLSGCAGSSGGKANVFVGEGHEAIHKISVLSFKAPTELIGASVSDLLTTELMKIGRYELIERGQLSAVLGETEVALSGLSAGQAAQLGKLAGANGVIVGTVSEYETSAQGGETRPVVGVSARLIDTTSGKIIWSINNSGQGSSGETTSEFARKIVQGMVESLKQQSR